MALSESFSRTHFGRQGGIVLWNGELDGGDVVVRDAQNISMKIYDAEDQRRGKGVFYGGLNFRFHFEYYNDEMQGRRGDGRVGILGLDSATIRRWASALAPERLLDMGRFVTVYAGYASEGPLENCELFHMAYYGATLTQPPEMWLNFAGHDSSQNVLSLAAVKPQGRFIQGAFGNYTVAAGVKRGMNWRSSSGMGVKEACEQVAEEFLGSKDRLIWNLGDRLEARLPKLRGFSMPTTMCDAVALLNSWGLVNVSVQNTQRNWGFWKSLVEDEENSQRLVPHLVVNPKMDMIDRIPPPKVISEASGMIGLPDFGINGSRNSVTVKTLLRKDIAIGDVISVRSRFMESPMEYYQVNKVAFDGELRGQQWYTTYTAIGLPGTVVGGGLASDHSTETSMVESMKDGRMPLGF